MAVLTQITPEGQALLETIAGPESAGAYDVIYGGSKFNDFSDHPRIPVLIESGPNKGKYSSAAGKYQFIGSTYDDIAGRYDIPDFSPQSQDTAAWILAQEEYARDNKGRSLQADLASGDVSRVPGSLKNQWTSMPGGIEQGITGNAFNSAYWGNMGLNLNSLPPDLAAITAATAGMGPLGQGAKAGNSDYMNALATKYAGSDTSSLGMMPGWSDLQNLGRKPTLPAIGPTGGPSLNGAPAGAAAAGATTPQKPSGIFDGLFSGIGGAFNAAGANIKGAVDTVGDMGVAAGGAIRNKINPLQAMAGIVAQKLPDNNLGQGIRAAMGFQNPNIGMTLGRAANGGNIVQGVNGKMNSITQTSQAWKDATGQQDRYTDRGDGSKVSESGGVYYDRHLR